MNDHERDDEWDPEVRTWLDEMEALDRRWSRTQWLLVALMTAMIVVVVVVALTQPRPTTCTPAPATPAGWYR